MQVRGDIWQQDRWGRLRNAALPSKDLAEDTRQAAELAADVAVRRCGPNLHSVYLTGPRARNRAGALELVFVLRRPNAGPWTDPFAGDPSFWIDALCDHIASAAPHFSPIRATLASWLAVFPDDAAFSEVRFRMGVCGVCVHGRDLTDRIAPQPISIAAANARIMRFRLERDRALSQLADNVTRGASQAQRLAADIASRFLGSAFALVMVDEGVYTEDDDLRGSFLKLHWPDRSDLIESITDLALGGSSTPGMAQARLLEFAGVVSVRSEDWLNRYNPQRAPALPSGETH